MHAILTRLAARRERHGPRSLRFLLEPDRPISVVIEPWNERLTFRRSIYRGATGAEIRLWGRRRLAILARALPLARSVRLHLLGTGLPSFAVVDFGGLRFTLGLSGWTANDWSRAGQFGLLAQRTDVDADTAGRVFSALSRHHFADAGALAAETGLDRGIVEAALGGYVQAGRAMFDLDKRVYRRRELTGEPLDAGALRFASEQEAKADRFLAYDRALATVSHYQRFTIPKKAGGVRAISAPMPRLKRAQYWVLDAVLAHAPVHAAAHGFVPGRSILTNAARHVGRDVVVNLDLKDFFPTLDYRRIKGKFRGLGYAEPVATVLALLCTEPDVDAIEIDGQRLYAARGPRRLPASSAW